MNSISKETALDNVIWAALSTVQAGLAKERGAWTGERRTDDLARCFAPEVAPFAGVVAPTPEAFDALHSVMDPGQSVVMTSLEPLPSRDSFQMEARGMLSVMVLRREIEAQAGTHSLRSLGVDDVEDMLALVSRTQPGPFGRRTIEMGHYLGVRDDAGSLVAMAGERMRVDGFIEASAICVDDHWRGKGLARTLLTAVCRNIQSHGATPFLHVFVDNVSAIGLYESLGFVRTKTFHLTRLTRRMGG